MRIHAIVFVMIELAASIVGPVQSNSAAPMAMTWYVAPGGNDSNNCQTSATACATIAAAIGKAANGDTIQIAAGVYNEHDIQVSKQLTLNGAGAGATVVDAGAAGRVFDVTSAVTMTGMRLRNGRTPAGALFVSSGGAILVGGAAHLTMRNMELADNNAADSGGAIFNVGRLTLEDTQVLRNTAVGAGGGIYNYNTGVATIVRSTIAHNTAQGYESGAGIYAGGAGLSVSSSTIADNVGNALGGGMVVALNGSVTLEGVTFSGNQADAGAALFATQGAITATNITVSGNNARNNYGGIYLTYSGLPLSMALKNSTIAYNTRTSTAGNGVNGLMLASGATATVVNTILAHNAGRNCTTATPPTSQGHNLSNDYTCGLTQAGDQQGVDPQLAALSNNGGPVATHALAIGSPAIDAGSNAACPAADARTVARPYDGDGNGVAVCDIGAVEARHQISIADATVDEGNSGTTAAVFNVTLAPASAAAISVQYATANGTATGGSDYTATAGTLTFAPGQTVKQISVPVLGDTSDEPDETFVVNLTTAANVDLLDAQATGTIVDDDGLPTLAIADAAVVEGNSGTTTLQFPVTLSPAAAGTVTVQYATVDDTAAAGSDYMAASGTLTFAAGQTSRTIAVSILGDLVDEGASERFRVRLSAPAGATLLDGEAFGEITDDDVARLSLASGPTVDEGDSGFTAAVFSVTLSNPAAFAITVDYEIRDGYGSTGARAGEDYIAATGTLTFSPGATMKSFTVQVIGDTRGEADEIFWAELKNASAPVAGNVSSATIRNDDNLRQLLPLILR